MAVALLWVGCENEEMNEPKQEVSFPLSICLPAEETSMLRPAGGPRRVMGDPGTTEQFELPNYIYIFIMKQDKENPANWTLWDVVTRTSGEWTKKRYVGSLPTTGDSIYEYKEQFELLLEAGEKFNGRVYAIASSVALEFNTSSLDKEHITSMSDLENLKFNSATVQDKLQHIYSTPHNLLLGDTIYYGSFSEHPKVPHVNLMLYHVAAKVDINWNVADSVRISKKDPSKAVRLTYMRAQNLFNGDAYCFKPMANTMASPLNPAAGAGDTINIVSASDEGLWWEGRSYFYTIPYTTTGKTGYFPLQMRMETNESKAYYRPTIYLQVDASSPFVPWLRATFNINAPLTAGTATKEVNLPTP